MSKPKPITLTPAEARAVSLFVAHQYDQLNGDALKRIFSGHRTWSAMLRAMVKIDKAAQP